MRLAAEAMFATSLYRGSKSPGIRTCIDNELVYTGLMENEACSRVNEVMRRLVPKLVR